MRERGAACAVCGSTALLQVPGFERLPRVTSDTKPFPPRGRLAICKTCGAVQKPADGRWREEAARIYSDYAMYAQSGGIEQAVFETETGAPIRRSHRLVERLIDAVSIPESGQLLDVGCGTGVTLQAFGASRPGWTLWGHDLDARSLPALQGIPGFAGLLSGPLEGLEGSFDVITLIHSLEHLLEPCEALATLASKLTQDGILVVQVPNAAQSPFDLLVADHRCHFDADTLSRLATRAGLRVEVRTEHWLGKELSLVCRPGCCELPRDGVDLAIAERVTRQVAWLEALIERARSAAARGKFGVFGTSIAGSWLFGALAHETAFFVDEDPSRIGGEHLGRPILAPRDVPAGSHVFVPLVPVVAARVAARLAEAPLHLHLPPEGI